VAIAVASGIWVRNRPAEKGLAPFGPPESPIEPSPSVRSPLGKIYSSPLLWHISVVYLLYGFTNIVVMTFFTAYLTKEVRLDEATAGQAWAVMGLMVTFGGLTWGTVSDRIGRRYGLAASLCLLGLAALSLTASQDLALIYASGALFGFCLTGAPAIVAAASGDYFGSRMAAPALGFLTVSFGLGQAIGPSLAGYIADMTGSFIIAFWMAGAASVLGAVGSLLLRR
jgi:predicted MFS family arabinose efflux permease